MKRLPHSPPAPLALLLAYAMLPACGSRSAGDAGDATSDAAASASSTSQGDSGPSDSGSETSAGTDTGPETSGTASETTGTTTGDDGNPGCNGYPYCDIFDPASCADGQKCTAISCDGSSWDAYACVD